MDNAQKETDLKIVNLCLPGCFYPVESLLNTCVVKLRTKKHYPVNLLNRSRGVPLGAFAQRLINSLWPGAVGAVGENTQQKWLHPRQFDPPCPKLLLYFLHPKFRKDGQNTAWMWQARKLSRTGWRTGEEVPVGAGILIKSFMRGNSEELIRNLHFTWKIPWNSIDLVKSHEKETVTCPTSLSGWALKNPRLESFLKAGGGVKHFKWCTISTYNYCTKNDGTKRSL